MDSPGSQAQPLKSSQTQPRSWIPSTSYTWPVTPWMSAADAFSKNSTTGAGGPQTPCTRPAGCLHTRSCLLTPHQQHQRLNLSAIKEHVALEVTWSTYQNIIDAYRAPDTNAGKAMMEAEINTLTSTRVPRGMTELMTLGGTLKRRARDILCLHQTTPTPQAALPKPSTHPSNTYAHPHSDLRNLTHYIPRCLLETGGFKTQPHHQLRRAR